ncbi:MAG: ketose-bisphosphate aldolase [Chloroflexota bacterium]|nr:MAG: ketose-bisphosphate aldolase [Chloroflexota bacterium]
MPLMTTRPMFADAYSGGYAVGAFNVNNMEIIQGIMQACAEENAPVILQISKGARRYADMAYLRALIDVAVKKYPRIPIAIHLDHGDTLDLVKQCIADGFTSVMIDGSHEPFDDNIALTRSVADYAHAHGVPVEAELGMLGGIEEDVVGASAEEYAANIEKYLTDPTQAHDFWQRSGCDSLAVAIGTSHGAYKFKHEARLAFDRIDAIMKICPSLPLVMHGSSSVLEEFVNLINQYGGQMPNAKGVPESAVTRGAGMGVCKVNIDTDIRLAMTAKIREVFATKPSEFDPRMYLGPARDAIVAMVRHKLRVLGASGKAEQIMARYQASPEYKG